MKTKATRKSYFLKVNARKIARLDLVMSPDTTLNFKFPPKNKGRKTFGERPHLSVFSKNGPFPASFSLFSSFLQTVNKCSIKVADD